MTIDEAIKDIKDNIKPVVGGKSLDMAIEALERQHWIPCSERLPDAEDMYKRPEHRYLCQRTAYGITQFFIGARLYGKNGLPDFWDWYGTKIRDSEVIAWMPLPEPYKEVIE